jgi:multiple sugar transport system substrate-binding protein
MTEAFQQENPNTSVKLTFVAYEALHDRIVTSAPAGTYDTVLMDVIWPAEFASRNMIMDVTERFPESERAKILPGALDTVKYEGRYYGVPWIIDTKYLYYNEEMLEQAGVDSPPETWDAVVEAARRVKGEGIVEYPLVWSWAQAEALMCDYATLLGAYGGSFFSQDGAPEFNTGGGLEALEFMQMTLEEDLSNPASTESLEEDVRRIVSQGEATMALNWTYMAALVNDPEESRVAGKVKVARTPEGPAGGPGVNGSMGLAISAGSKNQDAAWRYIQFMTSPEMQNRYAELSLPIWKDSYDKQEVIEAAPDVVPVARQQFEDMILRPVVPNYNDISQTMQTEIQRALTGSKSPKKALDDAASAVRRSA